MDLDNVATLIDQQHRAASLTSIPAVDSEVQRMLRELGEPIILFAENKGDRRNRLRKVIIQRQDAGITDKPGAAAVAAAASATPGAGAGAAVKRVVARPNELFYTRASEALIAARHVIAPYSIERARKRIREQTEARAGDSTAADTRAAQLYATCKTFNAIATQVGDDRPLSCVDVTASRIVTSGWGGDVKLWDRASCKSLLTWKGHTERVTGVAFLPGDGPTKALAEAGAAAAAGAASGASAGGEAMEMETPAAGSSVAVCASGSADSTVRLWSATSNRPVATLSGHVGRIGKVAAHPMGTLVGSSGYDKTWRLWDVATETQLLLQEGHSKQVYPIVFHPDGSLVATGDTGGIGRVWDIRTGKTIYTMKAHVMQLLALDFSPNGYHLVSGSDDNTAVVWDLRQRRNAYTILAHDNLVSQVKFAPTHGDYVATVSFDGYLKTWSSRDWSPISQVKAHDARVAALAVAPDEKHVVTCAFDKTFKIWGPESEF